MSTKLFNRALDAWEKFALRVGPAFHVVAFLAVCWLVILKFQANASFVLAAASLMPHFHVGHILLLGFLDVSLELAAFAGYIFLQILPATLAFDTSIPLLTTHEATVLNAALEATF